MSKIKNNGLDQHGAKPFEQQQYGNIKQLALNGLNAYLSMYL